MEGATQKMGELHFCPNCDGKLVAISERTGGFDGKKAAVGMVIAGGAVGRWSNRKTACDLKVQQVRVYYRNGRTVRTRRDRI